MRIRILTRYLIKAHAGPFLFALLALTGLIFLNAIAIRLENLAGKGLGFDVIWEFLYLSLPHTLALTLPMAVLVAVLYAFSELTAHNEITAMKAGGVRPQRMMLPLLVMGTLIAGGMLYFNDRVLSEANHALRQLLVDINRKTPTFILREQIVNEIRTDDVGATYWLSAARIDDGTSELFDVSIFDGSDPLSHRTTYAARGIMAFNQDRTDLFLTLFDGVVLETSDKEPGGFQQVFFDRQVLPLRGVGNELERQEGGGDRSDREMSIQMLSDAAAEREAELERIIESNRARSVEAVRAALGYEPTDTAALAGPGAGGLPSAPRGQASWDEVTRSVSLAARSNVGQVSAIRQSVSRYRVEIHKKYTLAFACIVFVLLGAPLAMRFPRAGLGLVITASSGIVAVYWMGLIGGESLADRGVAPPAITMWIPNAVFSIMGLWLFVSMGRETSTNRGGGWEDMWSSFRRAVAHPLRRAG